MYCPNCRSQVADNVSFCPCCGTNMDNLKNGVQQQSIQGTVVNTTPINNINVSTQNNNNLNKSKKNWLIILGLLLVVITGVILFLIFDKNDDDISNNDQSLNMNDEEILLDNSEFVTTFKNYEIEIEMDITINGVNTNSVSKGVMDELHQKEYLDITTISMGIVSLSNKMYHDFNTGYSYMTQPYGGDVWWKDKSASQMVDLGSMLDKLISMKNVTKVSDNHYKIKITEEDIDGILSSGNANTSSIIGDIYVEVYTENGYITKLEYDLTDILKGVEKFTTTIKYSNYDNAGDVEIPQSIIDSAIELKY